MKIMTRYIHILGIIILCMCLLSCGNKQPSSFHITGYQSANAGDIDSWSQVAKYVGHDVYLQGLVTDVYQSKNTQEQSTFMLVRVQTPRSYSVVVQIKKANFVNWFYFSPRKTYLNKKMVIFGNIEMYHGIPVVMINSPEQISPYMVGSHPWMLYGSLSICFVVIVVISTYINVKEQRHYKSRS